MQFVAEVSCGKFAVKVQKGAYLALGLAYKQRPVFHFFCHRVAEAGGGAVSNYFITAYVVLVNADFRRRNFPAVYVVQHSLQPLGVGYVEQAVAYSEQYARYEHYGKEHGYALKGGTLKKALNGKRLLFCYFLFAHLSPPSLFFFSFTYPNGLRLIKLSKRGTIRFIIIITNDVTSRCVKCLKTATSRPPTA